MTDPTNLDDILATTLDPPGWSDDLLEPDPERDPAERFRLDSDRLAGWAMRKLRAAEQRRTANIELADEQHAAIDAWLTSVNGTHNRDVEFFTRLLVDYALDCRANPDDGRKTVSVPGGKVSTRSGSLRWNVDADVFLPWAKANHPDLIRVREEPALSEIKAAINVENETPHTDDGEVVPGIVVEQSGPTASVTLD